MKKIIILIMSCRHEFFQKEVERILSTWGSDLPPNIDIMYYDGGWNINKQFEVEGQHIKVACDDSLKYTYLKTCMAFNALLATTEFDYILRVNTSTWVNTKLLRKFVDEIAEKNDPLCMYASEIYSLTEAPTPYPLNLYPRGNAFLINKNHIHAINNEGLNLLFIKGLVDDVAIGNAINTWHLKNRRNYVDYIKGMPHGWFKATPVLTENGHALCKYGYAGDMKFYNSFMTVQTKMYRMRELEDENMKEFYNMMKDAPEPDLKLAKKYIKNPSVFIGSILGYIPFSTWIKLDKNELYCIEINNKAIDDRENANYDEKAVQELHSF